jgi:hypothetical protein
MVPCVLCLVSALAGQSLHARFTLTAEMGLGGVVVAPWSQLRVEIRKESAPALEGRIAVYLPRGGEQGDLVLSRGVHLEEGALVRVLSLPVPVHEGGGWVSLNVRLEDERGVMLTGTEAAARPAGSATVLAVSPTRMRLAADFLRAEFVDVTVSELPESWLPLAGLAAVLLNDDRVSGAQAAAIARYVECGGQLWVSPRTAAGLNPETPAGRLLGASPTQNRLHRRAGDFPALYHSGGPMAVEPQELTLPARSYLVEGLWFPSAEESFEVWTSAGAARPRPGLVGIVSESRVGAGRVSLIHADLGLPPFEREQRPTALTVNLLNQLMERPAGAALASLSIRHPLRGTLEIAGRRIPGPKLLLLVLFVYVGGVGMGLFLLARKLRRSELFPLGLTAAAVLSLLAVFALGAVVKRAGEAGRAVHLVVADARGAGAAWLTLGAAYIVDAEGVELRPGSERLLSTLNSPGIRPARTHVDGDGAVIVVGEGARWQDAHFRSVGPLGHRVPLEFSARDGVVEVSHRGEAELRHCLLLVGDAGVQDQSCRWHYTASLAQGETLVLGTRGNAPETFPKLALMIASGRFDDFAREAVGGLLFGSLTDAALMHSSYARAEASLAALGLLPGPGEYLFLVLDAPEVLPAQAAVMKGKFLDGRILAVRGVKDEP